MTYDTNFELKAFLPYLLNQAAEASGLRFQRMYKERYGILRTEWRVLFHLGLYGELSARQIGQKARIHKTKISRAVHRLETRRMISRRRDSDDRRIEHLSLTSLGRAAFDDLSRAARDYDAEVSSTLLPEEERVLRSALKKLAQL